MAKKELFFLCFKPNHPFTCALNSVFYPKGMFFCFLFAQPSRLYRFLSTNPTDFFIMYKHADSPLW